MKVTNALILLQATASAEFIHLALPKVSMTHSSDDAPVKSVGLFYGSERNERTPVVATLIAAAAGIEAINVADTDGNFTFNEFDSIIVGAPTYNTGGVDHRSMTEWDDWLYEVLPNIDIGGKNIAIFCTGKGAYNKGDRWSGYPENFCDVAGELYDRFSEAGGNMMGFTIANNDVSTGGFNFTHSKAIRNDMFVGKMFDQKTQMDKSWGRANEWVEQLGNEGFF